jgi:heme o synthase
MLAGISLVIGSACVFNNVIDRRIDALMTRTKRRALVRGAVSPSRALILGGLLGAVGFGLLGAFTNLLTVLLALFGYLIYIVAYGLTKRRAPFGTVVGSLSGAVPPLVGYCAVTGRFDAAALVLFGILVLWQMPHFYAIAIFRLEDYQAAGLPVLPAKRGIHITKIYILGYIAVFALIAPLLTPLGFTGPLYLIVAALLGASWFWVGLQGFRTKDDRAWARRMFGFSLVVICVLSLVISLGQL